MPCTQPAPEQLPCSRSPHLPPLSLIRILQVLRRPWWSPFVDEMAKLRLVLLLAAAALCSLLVGLLALLSRQATCRSRLCNWTLDSASHSFSAITRVHFVKTPFVHRRRADSKPASSQIDPGIITPLITANSSRILTLVYRRYHTSSFDLP